jgi:hypothetical protein
MHYATVALEGDQKIQSINWYKIVTDKLKTLKREYFPNFEIISLFYM